MDRSVSESLRALLAGAIDYAGLFPPAELSLEQAANNYAEYRRGERAWALGSFVIAAPRLPDLAAAIPADTRPWPVALLVGPRLPDELAAMERFTTTGAGRVDWIEAKVGAPDQVAAIRQRVPRRTGIYFEIPSPEPAMLKAIREAGARAKIRTGGLTADAFPAPDAVACFLAAAAAHGVALKATAGLHHPVRCTRPLTYKPDSPTGTMHGFLNVLLAGVLARSGVAMEELTELLQETSADVFGFEDDAVVWRYHRISNQQIRDARQHGIVSLGSCSFTEPIEELEQLGLL